ncbi:MAG: hydantoinase/oxoprolinase family protein [Proteobacteria bacterium]|nr:hydantoinase/oxoprolinase family protein [Pseudomonadota bacterium]
MYRIGVDVGGTNTDAVVMVGRDILAAVKVPTSPDVTTGLMAALHQVRQSASVAADTIGMVVIGTTHFTNAVIERRHLSPTAIVRLCLPAAQCLAPMVDWPKDLRSAIGDYIYLASGGMEFDGSPIAPLDPAEISRIGADIRAKGLTSIAVCGVFSPISDASERQAAELLRKACPEAGISISSSIGQLGFLERESATILNASLLVLASRTVRALQDGLAACGLQCPLFLSQNDGTLMEADRAQRFPVLSFASGPTNSMRGAAFLSGHRNAIVLDVGGTTTDVGLLQNGFPRQASTTVDIGGVRTNFRMPDVFSIGLGGGSVVRARGGLPEVGPQSVGYEIARRARIFGGDVLTATDIVVAAGRAVVGEPGRVASIDVELVSGAIRVMHERLERAVDSSRVSADPIPIIAVGGGSILVPENLGGTAVIRPPHFEVANAIGAAIAQIGSEIDRVVALEGSSRAAALASAEEEARRKALSFGAVPESLVVTEREDVPLAYLKGDATRVRVKVVGDLKV